MRNLFTRSYDAIMLWAKSKRAVSMLSTVSFVESFIFPIPPDLLLIPLSISNPKSLLFCLAYYDFFSPWWGCWVSYWYLFCRFIFKHFRLVFDEKCRLQPHG